MPALQFLTGECSTHAHAANISIKFTSNFDDEWSAFTYNIFLLIKLPPKSQREEKQFEEEKGSLSQDKSENEDCALIFDLVFFCSIKFACVD